MACLTPAWGVCGNSMGYLKSYLVTYSSAVTLALTNLPEQFIWYFKAVTTFVT